MSRAISVVIPVCNEAEAIGGVIDEVLAVAGLDVQLIVVDDASDDATWSALTKRAAGSARVEAVRLRRRTGKSGALRVGIERARHDVVCMIDGDGQDVAQEIPRLLAALDAGLDVVGGNRVARKDALGKRAGSRVFNAVVGVVTGVHLADHNTGLKVATREALAEIPLHGDLHRFLYVLARHRGFRIGEIAVEHRPRTVGKTKYGGWRAVTALADLLLVRAHLALDGRAHRGLALVGATSSLLGGVALAYLVATWIAERAIDGLHHYVPLMQRPLLIISLGAILFGAQALAVAYVAALMGVRARPAPAIAEIAETAQIAVSAGEAARATHPHPS